MRPDGKYIAMRMGRYPDVRNFLSRSGTSSPVVCLVVVVHVGGDDKDGGSNPCRIPKEDNGEEGADKHIQDVGDTGGRRGVEGV